MQRNQRIQSIYVQPMDEIYHQISQNLVKNSHVSRSAGRKAYKSDSFKDKVMREANVSNAKIQNLNVAYKKRRKRSKASRDSRESSIHKGAEKIEDGDEQKDVQVEIINLV